MRDILPAAWVWTILVALPVSLPAAAGGPAPAGDAEGWAPVPLYRPLPPVQTLFTDVKPLFDPARLAEQWRPSSHGQNCASTLTLVDGDRVPGGKAVRWDMAFAGRTDLEYAEVSVGAEIPGPGHGFGAWIKDDPGNPRMAWRIRVVDASGEFHQYDLMRGFRPGWSYCAIDFGAPAGSWGGDGNRRPDYPCKLVSLLVDRPATAWKGNARVWIDGMAFVKKKPAAGGVLPFTAQARRAPLGHVYRPGATAELRLEAARGAFAWRVTDAVDRELAAGTGAAPRASLSIPLPKPGFARATVTWRDGADEAVAEYRCAALPEGAPVSAFVGSSVHFMRPWWPIEAMALLRRCGIAQIRDEIGWDEVEGARGTHAMPARGLEVLRRARDFGVPVLLILDYGNRHYANGGYPVTPDHVDAFARYATFVAGSTKGLCSWFEMWNEWCGGCGMSGRTGPNTPEAYGAFAKVVHPAVRGAQPDAVIVGVGGEPATGDTVPRMFRAGLAGRCDAWSVHPYRWAQPPEASGLVAEMESCLAAARAAGAPPRVWITEIGWTTPPGGSCVDEADQARFTVRGLALLQSIPGIEKVFLYDFMEDGTDPVDIEHHFGLFQHQSLGLMPKPAGPAVAAFSRLTAGATCAGRWRDGDLQAVRYQAGDGKDLLVAWSSGQAGEVTIGGTVSAAFDMMGNALPVSSRCALGAAPVYLSGQALKLQPAR